MPLLVLDWTKIIDGFSDHVHNAAQSSMSDRHSDRPPLVDSFHAAHHTFGGFHRDATSAALPQVLLHLKHDVYGRRNIEAIADHAYGLINRRHVCFRELNIHCRTGNLNYVSYIFCHVTSKVSYQPSAFSYQLSANAVMK